MQKDSSVRRLIFTLIAVALFARGGVEAQTGRVTLRGTLSETVALSVSPNLPHDNVHTDVVNSGSQVRIIVSGKEADAAVIRLPLLVRSNSDFRISAAVDSQMSVLTELSIVDVRATGALVSPQAISQLNVSPQFDLRELNEGVSPTNSSPQELARPLLMVSGPRVSLGGTLDSPNNALQITIVIRLKPQPGATWMIDLTFAANAGSLIR
jgi:hypothetical protein